MIGCSCYTCLPRTALAAAQSARKTAAPGTGTGAPQMDQRLLTNTWPKQCTKISIQANSNKKLKNSTSIHKKTAHKTTLELFYVSQRSRGYKERLKRS